MFDTLSDRLTSVLSDLRGKGRLSETDIDTTCREIRIALLEADVALPVVRAFVAQVKERAKGAEVSGALNPAQQVVKIVNEELVTILGGETRRLRFAKNPPTVIMLAGLQGSGKTTLAGKLARWLRNQGHTPMLAACDLQRPNAVTQLQIVGQRAEVEVFAPEPGNGVGDPVDVARRAIADARARQYDVLVVDTAGRLGVDTELMAQAADIRAAVDPDEVLFVVDAMIGQDAVAVARAFDEGVQLTGVVLTKLDGDARGGAALRVASVTGRPVMFASTGEGLADFEVFHPDRMASRILDMGDVLSLIEQAERAFDAEQAADLAARFEAGDDFTLEDFLTQMQGLRKMGSMKKMLGMLPGMAGMREQLESFDEREIDRVEAIVRSMTPQERRNPKILNGSRRARIARGSGRTPADVNTLMDRFADAQRMMRAMRSGQGMPGLGGGPGGSGPGGGGAGMGGGKKSRGRTAPPPKGKKSKSGNPAKRAQEERAAVQRALAAPPRAGSAFGPAVTDGSDGAGGAGTEEQLALPPGFDQLFQR